jgi:anti-anti-sigma factor
MSIPDDPPLSREASRVVFETPRVELCELSRHATVITLSGEHDLYTKCRLLEALARASEAPSLIVDLTPCVFVDSSIMGALLGACRSQSDDEQRVEFVLPDNGNQVNCTLNLMGVRALLRIHPSLGHALERAAQHDAIMSGMPGQASFIPKQS